MHELSQEAAEIAQELGDPEAQAYAWAAKRRANWEPAQLRERLNASTELLRCAREIGNLELELQAHAWLVVDLLEQGNRDAVEAQIMAFGEGAERVRQPLYRWQASVLGSMRAQLDGDLEQAARLADNALAIGSAAEQGIASQYHALQQLAIARERDQLRPLEASTRQMIDAARGLPLWRAALVRLLADTGRYEEARQQLEALAPDRFEALPQDANWLPVIAILAEACNSLKAAEHAQTLYELVLRFRDLIVVFGIGAVCQGSVERYLGLLAATAGGEQEAREHFERALERNARLQAQVCLSHTQLDLAELEKRSNERTELIAAAAQTAKTLSLPLVGRRVTALRAP
jgi:tetratricopeptide (TPR) repeat protein